MKRSLIKGYLLLTYLFVLLFWAILSTLLTEEYFSRQRRTTQVNTNESQSLETCVSPSIEQFPRPLLSKETRRSGALAIHFLVSIYLFFALAVICDEYFVPSLEGICRALKMDSDVAGATFMAAGSSAPELATSVIAVFIAKDDIGVGTVVGSAVYNIAFVVGICGLFAGKTVQLRWWPLYRDSFFYSLSIVAMLLSIYNENITWLESTFLLMLYVVYIIFMGFNSRVEAWVMRCIAGVTSREEMTSVTDKQDGLNKSYPESEEEDRHHVFHCPEGALFTKVVWFLSLPIYCCTFFTIPDCRRPRWRKFFLLTFFSSCVWIAVQSYFLVWMITIIGHTLNVADTVMGLTFLAAGVSVPDAIASLLVAREGLGDMAISNAVGSNVFDILVCLGLPWLFKTGILNPGSSVTIHSKGLTYSTFALLSTVVFLLVATHCNGWKLNKRYGFIMMLWYVAFMTLASMYELNIFGNFNLPSCPSDF